MTSPRQAEATAKGRYYTRPGDTEPTLISVTNVLSVGCAKPALVPWAAKVVAEHALDNLPSIVARSRTEDREALRKEISATVSVARDKAADLGSRIHALAEAHVTGQQLAPEDGDDEAHRYVTQYLRFLDDFAIDPEEHIEAAELTVANPGQGWAGTLDLMVRLPLDGYITGQGIKHTGDGPRGLWIVDLKTSATRAATSVYGEYALQLTALRNATEAWMPDGTIIPMPRGIVGVAVLNLRARTYELVPLPSGDSERSAWQGCLALAKWMHATGDLISKGEHRPVTPTGKTKPKRTSTRKAA